MAKDTDIPPTEPRTQRAAVATPPPKARTRISGASLAPDLEQHKAVIETAYYYWIGALPACPSEHLDLKGVHFPKVVERIVRGADGRTQRIPEIGSIVKLTEPQVRAMRDRLRRTVIRFAEAAKGPIGVGASLSDQGQIPRRRGSPVTLPTAEEVEERRRNGLASNAYRQEATDEPAARYLFAVLCHDQAQPQRGDHYPEPLEVTGLEWPGDLKE